MGGEAAVPSHRAGSEHDPRARLLWIIVAVWATNSVAMPLLIDGYTPDPMVNGVFTIVAGALFTRPRRNHDS